MTYNASVVPDKYSISWPEINNSWKRLTSNVEKMMSNMTSVESVMSGPPLMNLNLTQMDDAITRMTEDLKAINLMDLMR